MVSREKPENMGEIIDLYFASGSFTAAQRKKIKHAVTTVGRDLGFETPGECPVNRFPASLADLKSIPRNEKGLLKDADFRSIVSAAMKVVGFTLEKGWMTPPDAAGAGLGFPALTRSDEDSRWPRAEFVWDRLIGFSEARKRLFERIDDPYMLDFYGNVIAERDYLGRRDLRWFREILMREIENGNLPAFPLPELPSQKPLHYFLPLDEWSGHFQVGIAKIRSWFLSDLDDRRGSRKKVRETSANQEFHVLEQLGGFVVNIQKGRLEDHTWETLLSYQVVFDFIRFTDAEAEYRKKKGKILTGIYQQSLLDSYIRLAEGPLELPASAGELKNLRLRFLFTAKRDRPPKDLTPNSFFHCAKLLIQEASEEESRGHWVKASICRRDALVLALFGWCPRRTSTFHKNRLGDHVVLREGELPRLAIAREQTKTAQRDSILEIPPELLPLFLTYLLVDRPRLLGREDDQHGAFFVSQGGSPFCPDNARSIVRRRMKEYLGINIGPHSSRKAWTPSFLLYSDGDYLTAMAVLDTNLKHVEKAYRDAKESKRAEKYLHNTEETWNKIKEKRANGNGASNGER